MWQGANFWFFFQICDAPERCSHSWFIFLVMQIKDANEVARSRNKSLSERFWNIWAVLAYWAVITDKIANIQKSLWSLFLWLADSTGGGNATTMEWIPSSRCWPIIGLACPSLLTCSYLSRYWHIPNKTWRSLDSVVLIRLTACTVVRQDGATTKERFKLA